MTASVAAPLMSNMSTHQMETVDWLDLERSRCPVDQAQPIASIASSMTSRMIFQPKVSISDMQDLAEAIIAGGRIAAERICTNEVKARVRVESAMSIHFGSLMRDVLHTKTQCKAQAKRGNVATRKCSEPQWYRKTWGNTSTVIECCSAEIG